MFKRLFSRRKSSPSFVEVVQPFMDRLEDRVQLSSPTFTLVSGDNRGEVFITLDSASKAHIDQSSFTSAAIQMYTAGTDGVLGTTDDVRVHAALNYNTSIGRLTVRGAIPADHSYRVRIVATRFTANSGADRLDGEFHGAQVQTGNGLAGGNFDISIRRDTSNAPTVRMSTSAGTMNITLLKASAPKNVSNWLAYANTGRYDNIFWTRAISGFVIQGGGMGINTSNVVVDNPPFQKQGADVKVQGEPGVSNVRGTLAMALSGSSVSGQSQNNGTNEFFMNVADNTSLDVESGSAQSGFQGPFTVFGRLKGANDLATMDSIAAKPTIDFSTLTPPISFAGTDSSDVPVNNATQAQAGLNPARDLITIRRVAVLSRIFAT